MKEIRVEGDGVEVVVRGASTRFFGLDLYTAAIVTLIEEADTHGEEKQGNFEAASEFYADVLAAVARHYATEGVGEPTDEDQVSAGAILERMLADLRAEGRL